MSQEQENQARNRLSELADLIANLHNKIENNQGEVRELKARVFNAEIEIKQLKKKLEDSGLE